MSAPEPVPGNPWIMAALGLLAIFFACIGMWYVGLIFLVLALLLQ